MTIMAVPLQTGTGLVTVTKDVRLFDGTVRLSRPQLVTGANNIASPPGRRESISSSTSFSLSEVSSGSGGVRNKLLDMAFSKALMQLSKAFRSSLLSVARAPAREAERCICPAKSERVCQCRIDPANNTTNHTPHQHSICVRKPCMKVVHCHSMDVEVVCFSAVGIHTTLCTTCTRVGENEGTVYTHTKRERESVCVCVCVKDPGRFGVGQRQHQLLD